MPPPQQTPTKLCNCRAPDKCPLKGQCLVKEVVYQATITTAESTETYFGLIELKTRWRNHQMSFKNESKKNDTELSKHLWQLKDQKKDFAISWKILAKAKSYSNLTKRCNLCTCSTEKFYIVYKPDMATLNKRNELVSTCRHKRNFLLRFNRILNNQS